MTFLLYHLFFSVYIMATTAIITLYFALFLLQTIIAMIYIGNHYITYNFIQLLYQLSLLSHYYLHIFFRLLLLSYLSSSIILIICFPKYYIHYCIMTLKIIAIMDIIDIIAIIVSGCTRTQKWCLATQTGFNSRNAFKYI